MKSLRKIIFIVFLFLILISVGTIKYHKMNINDVGLNVLSMVKKLKGDAVEHDQIGKSNTSTMSHEAWQSLVQKHVTPSGKVNYKGFVVDHDLMQEYLDTLSEHPPGSNWTEAQQLAYWINAYNAFTVKLIIDHFPLKSIKHIGDGLPMINSPWDIKFFKIGGIDFDLNTIEHEILRKQFEEPRIHFAINCASVSCPKIRNEAFTAEQLEAQLEDQAKEFISNPEKNIISKSEVKLSKLFDWFKSDFTKNQSLTSFLQPYSDIEELNLENIYYMDYNWNLND